MDLLLFVSSKRAAACAPADAAFSAACAQLKKMIHCGRVDVETHEGRRQASQFGISNPPAFVLDGERIFSGKEPTAEDIVKLVQERLAAPPKHLGRRYWSVSGLPEQWGNKDV